MKQPSSCIEDCTLKSNKDLDTWLRWLKTQLFATLVELCITRFGDSRYCHHQMCSTQTAVDNNMFNICISILLTYLK